MNSALKKLKVSIIQNKLEKIGISKTKNEIWEKILENSNYDLISAGLLLDKIESSTDLNSLLNFQENNEKIIFIKQKDEEMYVIFSLMGFILGALFILFIEWIA
jgi:hypothetical protein